MVLAHVTMSHTYEASPSKRKSNSTNIYSFNIDWIFQIISLCLFNLLLYILFVWDIISSSSNSKLAPGSTFFNLPFYFLHMYILLYFYSLPYSFMVFFWELIVKPIPCHHSDFVLSTIGQFIYFLFIFYRFINISLFFWNNFHTMRK